MFGGTGALRKHLCPYVKTQTKNSPFSTCGRPHCKYSHSAEVSVETSVVSPVSSIPRRQIDLDQYDITLEHSLSGNSTALEEDDGDSLGVPQLEESILALQKVGITGLTGKGLSGQAALPIPTYSDAPCQALNEHNPYVSAWDEAPSNSSSSGGGTSQNDLVYDPVLNWKLPFRSSLPVSTTPDAFDEYPALTGAAAVRERVVGKNDAVIPLGRTLTGTSTISPAANSKKKAASPITDQARPVKKKARFGKCGMDEQEEQEKETLVKVKRESETVLFGIDDDDEDRLDGVQDVEMVDLPIQMPSKNPVKGFPKNPSRLLQSMSSSMPKDSLKLPPTSEFTRRPSAPLKRKIATPHQQVDNRMRALEEQQRSSFSAAVPVAAVDKGGKRVAHQPRSSTSTAAWMSSSISTSSSTSSTPRVALVAGCKLSLPFRQQVLERFIQHMSQIYKSLPEAVERAIQTEKDIATLSFHTGTYRSKVTQELVKLKQAVTAPPPLSASSMSKASSKDKEKPIVFPKVQTTVSSQVQKQNFSVVTRNPQQRAMGMEPKMWSELDFYTVMKKHVLTEDDLVINGYPLIQSKKQDGENRRDGLQLYIAMSGKITPDRITQTRRTCCRCKKEFSVDFEGNYGRDEECLYHWGKAFSRNVSGEGVAAKRTCCSDESSSRGCCVARLHVADTIPSLSGFVATVGIKPSRPEEGLRVYALDCEMIYTVGGIELARVTMVDRQMKCVYEALVKPKQRIVDCNTRFSGLKLDQFSKEKCKSIEEVHRDLLGPGGIINEETILIGHSLESDLLAMKLIHRNIVDTSIVFKHKRGLPFKRALRNLMRELLQKIIQEDQSGHDSREDAAACMELMIWKMKQDRERPRL